MNAPRVPPAGIREAVAKPEPWAYGRITSDVPPRARTSGDAQHLTCRTAHLAQLPDIVRGSSLRAPSTVVGLSAGRRSLGMLGEDELAVSDRHSVYAYTGQPVSSSISAALGSASGVWKLALNVNA